MTGGVKKKKEEKEDCGLFRLKSSNFLDLSVTNDSVQLKTSSPTRTFTTRVSATERSGPTPRFELRGTHRCVSIKSLLRCICTSKLSDTFSSADSNHRTTCTCKLQSPNCVHPVREIKNVSISSFLHKCSVRPSTGVHLRPVDVPEVSVKKLPRRSIVSFIRHQRSS